MSLIVASSSQSDYGGIERFTTVKTLSGIEAPSSFQNHFTSPIKIPKNAEIAVESIKIRRDGLMDINDGALFYRYFGKLQTTDSPGGGDEESRLEMPIPIRPKPGVYNIEEWITEIQARLNESYGNPEIFGRWTVGKSTNASGAVSGLTIKCDQRGDSSTSNISALVGTMLGDYWQGPYNLSLIHAPGTSWTSSEASPGKKIERLADNNASNTVVEDMDAMGCSVIGHGHPLGLVDGFFNVDTSKAAKGWRIGLSRPQMEYTRDTTATRADRRRANLLPGTRHPDGGIPEGAIMSTKYNMFNPFNGRNQKDFYDFMVENDGSHISIYNLSYDDTVYTNQLVQSEVKYYGETGSNIHASAKITTTSFNASFTCIEFATNGDKMEVYFGKIGDPGGRQLMVGNIGQTKRWESFVPISETRNALYPRLNIFKKGESLTINNYSSHYTSATAYRFPTYDDTTKVFQTGDDYYTNNRVMRYARGKIGGDNNKAIVEDTLDRPYCLSQTLLCDTKNRMVVDQLHVSTSINEYDGELAGNAGMNKSHALIIGYNEPTSVHDYLEGKYRTGDFSGQPKINRSIGFPDKSFLDQVEGVADGYAALSNADATVTFSSFAAPDLRSHSAFVRINNMPIQSYNGAKSSVSKIIYHLPRFTNDGTQLGTLFFAPGEKTYVSLHNTTPEILNNIEVQIVDINERPVQDLSGNTIVVFHLRQKS
tara:strand:- start:1748 stop:3874 length:2127 start_codon:yes stop_codon:yes gene_type:complete